jgi:hypothetical protein
LAPSDRDPCAAPWREWLKPQTIITLAVLVLGAIGTLYTMRESIAATNREVTSHERDCDVHHTTETLDQTYARRDVMGAQLESIDRRLSRIEDAVGAGK